MKEIKIPEDKNNFLWKFLELIENSLNRKYNIISIGGALGTIFSMGILYPFIVFIKGDSLIIVFFSGLLGFYIAWVARKNLNFLSKILKYNDNIIDLRYCEALILLPISNSKIIGKSMELSFDESVTYREMMSHVSHILDNKISEEVRFTLYDKEYIVNKDTRNRFEDDLHASVYTRWKE